MREKDERMILKLSKSFVVNSNVLMWFQFSGKIGKSPAGLNESLYIDKQGKTQWILSTLLAPINARRLFPCFDEPDFIATFSVAVVAKLVLEVLSNMDVASVVEIIDFEEQEEDEEGNLS